MSRLFTLFLLCVYFCSGCCYYLDTDNVQVFADDGVKDSYFSYSVLLQKGDPPIAIVGAPKSTSSSEGGSVYRCDLNASHCTKYNIPADSQNSFNGNFFGSVLDGDEYTGGAFFTCAPRVVSIENNENYLTYGLCFQQKNSSFFTQRAETIVPVNNQAIARDEITKGYYYNNGFAEAGMSISYIKEKNELFLGAPGIRGWTGATISYKLQHSVKTILPFKSSHLNSYEYLGYTVTTGKFEQSRTEIWYLAGAPRSNVLKGSVKIFAYDIHSSDLTAPLATLQGSEFGSYFGSSVLAVDLNNDDIDDILVGAPTASGKTWDEGYVEVYNIIKRQKFEVSARLFGSGQSGAKFGSSIASLGDIDLDGFNDVAISAPYENGGTGAVYIYRGGSSGIQNKYTQRLVPSHFKLEKSVISSVKGFGCGLSKGNDIDGNGHNDLAVGAYKSDQLFVFRANSIINFALKLTPNITIISTDTDYINVACCLSYSQRSKTRDLTSVGFKLELKLDYRINGQSNISEILEVKLDEEMCMYYDVQVKHTIKDISPFKIKMKGEVLEGKLIAIGDKTVEQSIPFSHGCGDDNICTTELSVRGYTETHVITIGLNNELDIYVEIENFGEPAYQCELYLELPKTIDLKNPKNCNRKDNIYMCPIEDRLLSYKKVDLTLYLKNIDPSTDSFGIPLEVKSIGKNNGSLTKDIMTIFAQLQNSPFITGESDPESVALPAGTKDEMKDIEINQKFSVGNYGPSPIKLDVSFLLPLVKNGEDHIFHSIQIEASLNGIKTECGLESSNFYVLRNETIESLPQLVNAPLNRTIILSCVDENVTCMLYSCMGDYFYKSSGLAVYELKVKAKMNLVESTYAKQLETKNLIAFISMAFLRNSSNIIQAHASTLIFYSGHENKVAIWIYIVASIGGAVLLVLLVLILYKCHFFDRNYKDKLSQEKLLNPNADSKNNPETASSSVEDFKLQSEDQTNSSEEADIMIAETLATPSNRSTQEESRVPEV